jgi:hypothetical protein
MDALLQANDIEALRNLERHQLRILPGPTEYLIEDWNGTRTLPTPEQLKEQVIHALLHELVEPDEQTAELLPLCDFDYEAKDDWDCEFAQLVGLVISAPERAYTRLSDGYVWSCLISLITGVVCTGIGGDRLALKA